MTNDTFESIMRYISLPLGTLLQDGTTYRIEKSDFPKKFKKELTDYDKFLVLSDGRGHAVGGVLFYGSTDIQVTVLSEYRGSGYYGKYTTSRTTWADEISVDIPSWCL